MEFLIYYVLAREITISNALQRHFWWYENACLIEELHCHVVLALAGKDEVAPAESVRDYVEKMAHHKPGGRQSVELLWWENMGHAECIASPTAVMQLVRASQEQEQAWGLNHYCIKENHDLLQASINGSLPAGADCLSMRPSDSSSSARRSSAPCHTATSQPQRFPKDYSQSK